MATTSLLGAIQALALTSELKKNSDSAAPERPVVTLSRDHGSGGDEIARMLSARLDVPLYDQDILDQVAKRLEADPIAIKQIDDCMDKGRSLWLYRLFTGQDVSTGSFRHTLIHVILRLGAMGGVLVGRGGNVILSDRRVLRVRICGSPAVCARRLASARSIPVEDALKQVGEVNHNRGKIMWEMFQSRLNDPHQFDITINTDHMNDLNAVVGMLVFMAKAVHGGVSVRHFNNPIGDKEALLREFA